MNYKVIKILFAFGIIISFASCNKFLDVKRQGEYDAANYPYPGGSGPYDQFIFGAYNELRTYDLHSQYFICATIMRSDDADKGSTPSDGGANASDMDNFPVQPGNGYLNGLWLGHYALITRCNETLDAIDKKTDIEASDEVKNKTRAEARFLRAYAYFNLVRFWGNVPLIDKVFADAAQQSNVPQSAPSAIYKLIEDDLSFAAANLPSKWDANFAGRATKGAANGLLAKAYLTQQKWQQAQAAANAVISSGVYDLSTDYATIFREVGENSKESVFEVQATATSATLTANGVQYAPIMGVRGSGVFNLGWGWCTPSQKLADAYEPNDPRKAATILFTSNATTTYNTLYGEVVPIGLPNTMYNNKVYSNPDMRKSIGSQESRWMNIRLLRYADVVLMHAEASNEIAGEVNISQALSSLNLIRTRARKNAPVGTLPDLSVMDQSQLREAIRKERRIELAMEHDRFFDVVRWGIAQTVFTEAGKTKFVVSRDTYLPIPQTQIDLSKKVLLQNPGY